MPVSTARSFWLISPFMDFATQLPERTLEIRVCSLDCPLPMSRFLRSLTLSSKSKLLQIQWKLFSLFVAIKDYETPVMEAPGFKMSGFRFGLRNLETLKLSTPEVLLPTTHPSLLKRLGWVLLSLWSLLPGCLHLHSPAKILICWISHSLWTISAFNIDDVFLLLAIRMSSCILNKTLQFQNCVQPNQQRLAQLTSTPCGITSYSLPIP